MFWVRAPSAMGHARYCQYHMKRISTGSYALTGTLFSRHDRKISPNFLLVVVAWFLEGLSGSEIIDCQDCGSPKGSLPCVRYPRKSVKSDNRFLLRVSNLLCQVYPVHGY